MLRKANFCGLGLIVLGAFVFFAATSPSWGQGVAWPGGTAVASDYGNQTGSTLLAQKAAEGAAPPAQKPAAPAQPEAEPPSDFLANIYGRTASEFDTRLAGTPNMFGDSLEVMNGMWVSGAGGSGAAASPLAGGNRRMKIAENDNSLPQDRVFFLYNHFQNAGEINDMPLLPPAVQRSLSLDRYIVGFEKTFLDGLWSFEIRMPFGSGYSYQTANFGAEAGQIGNLSVVLKRVLYKSDTTVAAVGLCLDAPTGSDATGSSQAITYNIQNQATFLMPYLGILRAPNDKWFYQAFLQLDVPTNGNTIDYINGGTTGTLGTLHDQTLLYADFSLGRWLMRNPDADWLTGLAGVLELHYISTMQDADIVTNTVAGQTFSFGNFSNRVDVLNLTLGLHAELTGNTLCRVAGVVPLRTESDRLFDAEIQVQLERRF